ncbi:hypothetical protein AVEN_236328-1 [Araneus ventricosus]|uniref:Uncharacterized protein n=1 Tax=Araneus ventricosus TaxID=182803 RepID=A0A4Y2JKS8_ARAVE|nr:hypothetical protein AVEN_236328-1 [Araneus ventricosus]
MRSLKRVRRATLPQIAADFNAGALRNVSVRTVEWTIIHMGFRNRCPTRVPLLTVRHTASGPANAAIELLMTGNKLPGLTSLVSNCIGWMDMYRYGDNLRNPWTQYVNRELFNLVEPLRWYGAFAVGLI